MKRSAFAPSAVLLTASLALAQSFGGAILGTVKDPTRAVIPGVTAAITNAGTNVRTEILTDASGTYVVPELAPGRYTVRCRGSSARCARGSWSRSSSALLSTSSWRSAR